MNLNYWASRNYIATEKRGQISKDTTSIDFINKTYEEVNELVESVDYSNYTFDPKESVDIILVQLSMLRHFYPFDDIEKMIKDKVRFNEKRP